MRLNLRVEYSHNSYIAKIHAKITFIDFCPQRNLRHLKVTFMSLCMCTVGVPKIDIKIICPQSQGKKYFWTKVVCN